MTTSAYTLLEAQLRDLHLAALLERYHEEAQAAVSARWPYETYLATLIQQEVDRRSGNRLQRRIKDAHLPALKELAEFDFAVLPTCNPRGCSTWLKEPTSTEPSLCCWSGRLAWGRRTWPSGWVLLPVDKIAVCVSTPSPA